MSKEKLLELALDEACKIIAQNIGNMSSWKADNYKAHCLKIAKEKLDESNTDRK